MAFGSKKPTPDTDSFLLNDEDSGGEVRQMPTAAAVAALLPSTEMQVAGSMTIHGAPLPTAHADRKKIPLFSGVMKYFPDALVAVAELSRIGNDQHNAGQPLHWSREKSNDHEDCAARHLLEVGTLDTDGVRHATKLAWRALAILQLEIEKARRGPEPA